ncbi:MAG TPA: CoA transferase [Candidatus Binataceae bacterium]|nr:CoA transferase [Candidatus Binataceae bacterium]
MTKALQEVNVVEFSSHHGAEYAAMLLAEQGANAIKIEPRGGSRSRGTPHFHVLNRSKRSVIANPNSASDRDATYDLIRRIDASQAKEGSRVRWQGISPAWHAIMYSPPCGESALPQRRCIVLVIFSPNRRSLQMSC